jgi:hypothetical protein
MVAITVTEHPAPIPRLNYSQNDGQNFKFFVKDNVGKTLLTF